MKVPEGVYWATAEREFYEFATYYNLPMVSVKACCYGDMMANKTGFQVRVWGHGGGGRVGGEGGGMVGGGGGERLERGMVGEGRERWERGGEGRGRGRWEGGEGGWRGGGEQWETGGGGGRRGHHMMILN